MLDQWLTGALLAVPFVGLVASLHPRAPRRGIALGIIYGLIVVGLFMLVRWRLSAGVPLPRLDLGHWLRIPGSSSPVITLWFQPPVEVAFLLLSFGLIGLVSLLSEQELAAASNGDRRLLLIAPFAVVAMMADSILLIVAAWMVLDVLHAAGQPGSSASNEHDTAQSRGFRFVHVSSLVLLWVAVSIAGQYGTWNISGALFAIAHEPGHEATVMRSRLGAMLALAVAIRCGLFPFSLVWRTRSVSSEVVAALVLPALALAFQLQPLFRSWRSASQFLTPLGALSFLAFTLMAAAATSLRGRVSLCVAAFVSELFLVITIGRSLSGLAVLLLLTGPVAGFLAIESSLTERTDKQHRSVSPVGAASLLVISVAGQALVLLLLDWQRHAVRRSGESYVGISADMLAGLKMCCMVGHAVVAFLLTWPLLKSIGRSENTAQFPLRVFLPVALLGHAVVIVAFALDGLSFAMRSFGRNLALVVTITGIGLATVWTLSTWPAGEQFLTKRLQWMIRLFREGFYVESCVQVFLKPVRWLAFVCRFVHQKLFERSPEDFRDRLLARVAAPLGSFQKADGRYFALCVVLTTVGLLLALTGTGGD